MRSNEMTRRRALGALLQAVAVVPAATLFAKYAYAADLHYDQQINLADVVRLAHAWGASCP